MNRPKNKEDLHDVIYDFLKEKYGEHVISEKDFKHICVFTDETKGGNNDVWINMEYFH